MIIIDVETTGVNPHKSCMVSLGAIDYSNGEEFYEECGIYPDSEINDKALQINGFSRGQIQSVDKKYPHEVLNDFLIWSQSRICLLAGHNVGSFDALFLLALMPRSDLKWPFGYRTVDLHSVFFAKYGLSMNLDGILSYLGLPTEPKPHNALTGARMALQAFRKLI